MGKNCQILNRDFQHPADGWYQIEAKGSHPNARAGVVQIIDDAACQSIVNRFNAAADKPGFAGMLIDHEHFQHDASKETRAYGWLMRLDNRADGIYAQIRWTGTGKKAVDDGDYRFFSTEYDCAKGEMFNDSKPPRFRPLELAGLTLTNVNNNKGQKPITNRTMNKDNDSTASAAADQGDKAAALAASKRANDASEDADSPRQHEQAAVLHRKASKLCENCGNDQTAAYHSDMSDHHDTIAGRMRSGVSNREFPGGNPAAADAQKEKPKMKSVLTKLGLREDASEADVLAAVTKVLNRNTELEAAVVESDLATYSDRIADKQKEFVKSALLTNRAATLEYLKSLPKLATSPRPVHNRATAQEPDPAAGFAGNNDADRAKAIREGIEDIRLKNRDLSYSKARDILRRQKPELFTPVKAAAA